MKNPKLDLIYPTPEEDAQLVAAAMDDPDNLPLTDEEWETVKPWITVGRPRVAVKRPTLNMRVDADVLAALRATGQGWQTRINAILREAVATGRV